MTRGCTPIFPARSLRARQRNPPLNPPNSQREPQNKRWAYWVNSRWFFKGNIRNKQTKAGRTGGKKTHVVVIKNKPFFDASGRKRCQTRAWQHAERLPSRPVPARRRRVSDKWLGLDAAGSGSRLECRCNSIIVIRKAVSKCWVK